MPGMSAEAAMETIAYRGCTRVNAGPRADTSAIGNLTVRPGGRASVLTNAPAAGASRRQSPSEHRSDTPSRIEAADGVVRPRAGVSEDTNCGIGFVILVPIN